MTDSPSFEVFNENPGPCMHITFANGVTVSLAFGKMNYCDGGTSTVETAIWDSDNEWIPYKEGDVQGYQTPADVLAALNYAASLPCTR